MDGMSKDWSYLFVKLSLAEALEEIPAGISKDLRFQNQDTFYIGFDYFHKLSVLIHIVVILLILPTGYIVQPLLIVQIPLDGLLDAFLELEAGFPTQFALELGGVDGITGIMAKAVGDVGDEIHVWEHGVWQ